MTLKTYHEPGNSCPIIDGPESETGGEPRKLGLLLPKDFPNVCAKFADSVPLLDEATIRKILDDPNRKNGRNRFGPDWTKDQNGRGACQGYASAGCVERARVRRGLAHVKISGDFAYCLVNGGSDSGSHLAGGMQAAEHTGYCSEDTVNKHGLRHEYRKSQFPQECFQEASRFKGFEAYHADTKEELLTGLALDFDAVVAVQAGGSGGLDQYGICQWSNGSGNHAVLCDDVVYDTRLGDYKFDHQNSWGTRWGQQGRSYLTYERHFVQSIRVHRFYLIRSTMDDPQGDNPPQPKP